MFDPITGDVNSGADIVASATTAEVSQQTVMSTASTDELSAANAYRYSNTTSPAYTGCGRRQVRVSAYARWRRERHHLDKHKPA